jgi:hypothetical protein
MYLRLAPNLLHVLPDLGAPFALRHMPNLYEIHPWSPKMVFLSSPIFTFINCKFESTYLMLNFGHNHMYMLQLQIDTEVGWIFIKAGRKA